jgi:hypothetical protein
MERNWIRILFLIILPISLTVAQCEITEINSPAKSGVASFNGATITFLNNTAQDGRKIFITSKHVFPSDIGVGETTTWQMEIGGVKKDYKVKLLLRSIVDRVLCEVVDNTPPIKLLGWDKRYQNIGEPVTIGYGEGTEQIAYPTLDLKNPNPYDIEVYVKPGNGSIKVGFSGAPLVDETMRFYGHCYQGSVYGCDNDPQSEADFMCIGYGWGEIESILDPIGSGVDYINSMDIALPVELSSFNAKLKGNTIELYWQTETEVDNYGFEIYRKYEEGEYEKIGFVNGNGNSNSVKRYFYTDKVSIYGKYFYKLKQIDTDGDYEYSSEVSVNHQADDFYLMQNYPNPFNGQTVINYGIPEAGKVDFNVYDMMGELVYSQSESKNPGNYKIEYDAGNLSSGIYLYTISWGNRVEANKMIITK